MSEETAGRPEKIHWMIKSDALREGSFSEDDVANLWWKAINNAKDAQIADLSIEGAIQSGYAAVFNACLAVLAFHGLRTGTARNHHENVFAAVSAYDIPGLETLIPESTEIRNLRKGSMYDPVLADETDRSNTIRWMLDSVPKMHGAFAKWSPQLGARLARLWP